MITNLIGEHSQARGSSFEAPTHAKPPRGKNVCKNVSMLGYSQNNEATCVSGAQSLEHSAEQSESGSSRWRLSVAVARTDMCLHQGRGRCARHDSVAIDPARRESVARAAVRDNDFCVKEFPVSSH